MRDDERAKMVQIVHEVGDRLRAELADEVLGGNLSDEAFERIAEAYISQARDELAAREQLVAELQERRLLS
jgi:hypothetical protein